MEIRLDLSTHCIETELKRLHNRFLSLYFKHGGKDIELEEKIQHICLALETLDFPSLRSRFPGLAGGCKDLFFLLFDEQGGIRIRQGTEDIYASGC
jgi:hypothetical protein